MAVPGQQTISGHRYNHQNRPFSVGKTMTCLPSPSHHRSNRWYVYHSQSWVVYDIVLPTIYHLINILILTVPTSEQKVDSDRLFEHLGEHGSTPHFPDDTRIFFGILRKWSAVDVYVPQEERDKDLLQIVPPKGELATAGNRLIGGTYHIYGPNFREYPHKIWPQIW